MQQRLRDALAVLRHGGGQAQKLRHAVFAAGGGADAVQQLPRHHGAPAAGDVLGAQVKGGGPVKAEDGVAHRKVGPGLQSGGKIGQGGGGALHILADQQHACHRIGQLALQRRHQPELAVQLVRQRIFQRQMAAGGVNEQIAALGIGVHLLRQLSALQGTVTAVHHATLLCAQISRGTACAKRAAGRSASSCCSRTGFPARSRRRRGCSAAQPAGCSAG